MHLLRPQIACIVVSSSFGLFIFSTILLNSLNRSSIINTENSDPDQNVESIDEGYFELNNFDRFEVKQGELSWRIKADKARHFSSEGLTQIIGAVINFHRADGSNMEVSSARAKVFGNDKAANKAELEGDVKVAISEGISAFGPLAVYNSEESKLTLADGSLVKGSGFEVTGEIMDVFVDKKYLSIRGGVRSIFEPNAKLPKKSGILKIMERKVK